MSVASAFASSQQVSNSTTSRSGFSSLSSEDFTKIVLTELTKQDPLQPNDTNALLQQISTIRSIQSDTDLTDNLSKLISQNDFAAATTLIGKTISGVSIENTRVSGNVSSIAKTNDGTFVKLASGDILSFANIDRIDAPTPTTPPSNP
jgi:flagellar basal-body rod modification protein FlgD